MGIHFSQCSKPPTRYNVTDHIIMGIGCDRMDGWFSDSGHLWGKYHDIFPQIIKVIQLWKITILHGKYHDYHDISIDNGDFKTFSSEISLVPPEVPDLVTEKVQLVQLCGAQRLVKKKTSPCLRIYSNMFGIYVYVYIYWGIYIYMSKPAK